MNQQKCRVLALLACSYFLAVSNAIASSEIPPGLVGTWNYSSLTIIKNGKPFGTVHFRPGQWTLKLNADGTYLTKGPLKSPSSDSSGSAGKYEVHKHDLGMRPDDGGHDLKYNFKLKQGGKVLMLTDENDGTIISATRE